MGAAQPDSQIKFPSKFHHTVKQKRAFFFFFFSDCHWNGSLRAKFSTRNNDSLKRFFPEVGPPFPCLPDAFQLSGRVNVICRGDFYRRGVPEDTWKGPEREALAEHSFWGSARF